MGIVRKTNKPGDLVPYLFGDDDGTPLLLQHLAYIFLGTPGNSRKEVLTRVTVAGLTPAHCYG